MSRPVYVAGVGMTAFGKFPDKGVKSLARTAILESLADAGLGLDAVEIAYFGNVTQGYYEDIQYTRGQIALRAMGLQGIPIINVENACATGATAFGEAARAVRAGDCDVALAIGVEKMTGFDPARALGIFDRGWDPEKVEENLAALMAYGDGVTPPPEFTVNGPYSAMMEVYAAWARRHMKVFGTRPEHFAMVAAKNHEHAVHNDRAQFRQAMTPDQVLSGRKLAYPLTVPMCSPISDGAAAAVLVSGRIARRASRRAARVRATEIRSSVNRGPGDTDRHIVSITASAAYERAGLGPGDVSVAEVHDATAVGEIMHIEHLGLCPMGEGGPFTATGATRIGGRLPVNPSGGLESKGHPLAATGLGQVFEIVTQLRGEAGPRQVDGASIGIIESSGGVWGIEEAAAGVIILERPAN
jgi:acetyl-CoA acetyltransferase